MTARRLHFWLTIVWFVAAFPIMLIRPLRESIPLLVFVSVYANSAGHYAAYQATRAEDAT